MLNAINLKNLKTNYAAMSHERTPVNYRMNNILKGQT